ncbi:WXG100 family type VII secretion target [Kitasatospora sp. NPDC092286]|uniref:WXG100 family type VII secretion target n=1 Tax=Kitasatospora sp. NPDC092286 TaxID=3364087 RepID=UPI003811A765
MVHERPGTEQDFTDHTATWRRSAGQPVRGGLFDGADGTPYPRPGPGTTAGPEVTVTPAELRARAGTVDEIHACFSAVDDRAQEWTTTAYGTLGGWRTGPELRARAIRWDNQVATLGNTLHDIARRLRTTADAYTATEDATGRNLSGER